ncbi:phosphoribosylanthranilate isomerase [Noviherbaspirillum humi]|uniref:Phosphoribosylanthranilate isomerase n=1 Tax=Noviherbaspirillum humi TaxID=1688639 RepID=A0A239F2J1_9BURK|nr:hypothetical protein [Noviherbaspirillum humi]SNS51220.1 phosphoribosylanthranilate isomerase [Noviherbaspirillum humi]
MKIYPVIHHLDGDTSLEQARLAFHAGADGVFLISHDGRDAELPPVAAAIKRAYPERKVGLNMDDRPVAELARMVPALGLDMLWADYCGVDSQGIAELGRELMQVAAEHPGLGIFACVAFKYQKPEPDPPAAARFALEAGFMPTTSGSGTGIAAPLEKIRAMSAAVDGKLAIASGMTCDNVAQFAPLLSAILVATGVSRDEHHFDETLLARFIELSHANARQEAA